MAPAVNLSAPNLVVLCVDAIRNADFNGRCYHRYAEQAQPFTSLTELLGVLEHFYDDINFPRATLRYRSFLGETTHATAVAKNLVQEASQIMEQKGSLATFVVQVQHRQNATWQGKITWLDSNQEQYFRSTLELLRLMDEAVDHTQKGKE